MSNITLRIDDGLRNESQKLLEQMGLNFNTAFTMFLRQLCTDQALPFRPHVDPFYSTANQRYLEGVMQDVKSGKAHFTEHELIEVD